jgi:hypothetical protein
MNFVVFSDGACRTTYLDTIRLLPIMGSQVHVYGIEAGADSQWVIVMQTDGKKRDWRLFLRTGEKFVEKPPGEFPIELRDKILERCPNWPFELVLSRSPKGPGRLEPRKDAAVPAARSV